MAVLIASYRAGTPTYHQQSPARFSYYVPAFSDALEKNE